MGGETDDDTRPRLHRKPNPPQTEAGLNRVKGTGQALKDDIERLEREYGDVTSRLSRAKTDLDITLTRLEDAQRREQDGRTDP